MSAVAHDTVKDDQSGQELAEKWGLEYLKASSLAVDPRALPLLERADCRRLRAIPLAAGSGGALVAVCSPSEESFSAIRELTGEHTRFALVAEGTLDALLGSRMFAEPPAAEATQAPPPAAAEATETAEEPEPPAEPEADAPEIHPDAGPAEAARRAETAAEQTEPQEPETATETPPAPAEAQTPSPDTLDNIVGAVLSALKQRGGSETDRGGADAGGEVTALASDTAQLIANIDTTVENWSALRAALVSVHEAFEETKRALRETKEQLSVAHADNDQYRKRVRSLEGELAESRELAAQARTRLQEAADLLESGSHLEESAEIL